MLYILRRRTRAVLVLLGCSGWTATCLAAVPAADAPANMLLTVLDAAVPAALGAFVGLSAYLFWALRGLRQRKQELARAYADAQAWRDRYETAIAASQQLLFDWDIRADRTEYGGNVEHLLGAPPERTSTLEGFLGIVHPDDRETYRKAIEDSLQRRRNGSIEYRIVRPDGDLLHVRDSWRVLLDADGAPRRVIGTRSDLTDRHAQEERLRRANRLEAIGQLTGGIAHDFNNLLTVVIGLAELVQQRLRQDDPNLAHLNGILRAATRASELTARLLAFARRQPLRVGRVDCNRLLADMDPLLRRTLGTGIEIETVLAGGLWSAVADQAQLESALVNLCLNARDAMPQGGALTIETANVRLDESYALQESEVRPGAYVMLAVTDTGTGMAPDVMLRAFEPFFSTKGTAAKSMAGGGTGLGLSMVYGFMKQSGGHVKIYSEPGLGTTVKLYLPRADAAPLNEPLQREEARTVPGSETILLVEDDPLVRAFAEQALKGFGYNLVVYGDPRVLRDELDRLPQIDLLFTDVVLPGQINGRQVADMVRGRFPDVRVLYTTGYTQNAVVHQGRLDADVDLLQKPYRSGELNRRIRQALDGEP